MKCHSKTILKLFLLLLVLFSASASAYCLDEEPLTAEELQGLPEATLIEIILTYDQNLSATEQDLSEIKTAWMKEQEILNQDKQRLTERQAEAERLAELFETSLKLQSKRETEIILEKIGIGVGSAAIAGLTTYIIVQFSQ